MSASIWLRQVQSRFFGRRPAPGRRRAQKAPPKAKTVRPRLEVLEDRLTPTTFTPTVFTDGVNVPGAIQTLRDAVLAANADTGSATDTIQLSAGTYMLTLTNPADHEIDASQGDLNINNNAHALIIQGATDANGKPTSIIDQTVADRVFQIVQPGTTVTFKNVVIEGCNAQDDGTAVAAGTTNAQGGGILDDGGNVKLSNVVVQSNKATAGATHFAQGGGVLVKDGSLTINHSVIQNNQATGSAGGGGTTGGDAYGGGVGVVSAGVAPLQLSINTTSVVGNKAQGGVGAGGIVVGATGGGDAHGGGVYSEADSNIITASTLARNTSTGGTGGQGNPDGNGTGGGAELFGINTFINSTIANNSASGSDAGGGGVYFAKGASGQVTNVTVARNQATLSGTTGTAEGGGLDNDNGDIEPVTLINTIVALNTAVTAPDVRGGLISGGHNLIGISNGVNDPGFTAPGDLAGTAATPLNPNLGNLANNGGPTQTLLPLPGSPALGAGDPSHAPTADQRGVPRPLGGPTDIGSVQVSATSSSPSPSPSPSSSPSPSPSPAPPPPTLHKPPLLALFDSQLGGVETINADTETVIDSFFGFQLLVSTYDQSGNLVSVTMFGINVTLLFELL